MRPILRSRLTGMGAALAIILLAATLALAEAPRTASALTNCTVADNSFDGEESAFLGLINAYRAQNGLGALSLSSNLPRNSATRLGRQAMPRSPPSQLPEGTLNRACVSPC